LEEKKYEKIKFKIMSSLKKKVISLKMDTTIRKIARTVKKTSVFNVLNVRK